MSKPAGFVRAKAVISNPRGGSAGTGKATATKTGGAASTASKPGRGPSSPQAKPIGAGLKPHKTNGQSGKPASVKGLGGIWTQSGYKKFMPKNW